jgi:nicotinamidase-related amidase
VTFFGDYIMNKALLTIEFQQEWLSPSGKLFHLIDDPDRLEKSIEQAKKALSYARQRGWLVLHSGLSFQSGYPELGTAAFGLRARIQHNQAFLAGSEGAKFHPDFIPRGDDLVVDGRLGASAFSGSNLDSQLRNNNVTELFIMGYALNVCVESTLRAAHDLGYNTRVISDAGASFTQTQEEHFNAEVVPHFGEAISTEQLVAGAM